MCLTPEPMFFPLLPSLSSLNTSYAQIKSYILVVYKGRGLAAFLKCASGQCLLLLLLQVPVCVTYLFGLPQNDRSLPTTERRACRCLL